MSHPFTQFLAKELRQNTSATFALVGLCALWYLLLDSFQRDPEKLMSLSLTPLYLLPFWAAWRAYAAWRREWSQNHLPLLLMLPVPGWWLVTAKTLVVLGQTAVGGAVAGVAILAVNRETQLGRAVAVLEWDVVLSWALLYLSTVLLAAFCLTAVAQFAALVGRLVGRFGGLVSALGFLTGGWALVRFAGLVVPVTKWLPPLMILGYDIGPDRVRYHWLYIKTPGFIGVLLGALLLVWLASWLVERHLEV